MENSAGDFEQHIPSFFKNSCPGTSAEGVTEEDCFSKNSQGTVTFRPVDAVVFRRMLGLFLALQVGLGICSILPLLFGTMVGTLFIYVFRPPMKCNEHTLCPGPGLSKFCRDIICNQRLRSSCFSLLLPFGIT